jgi:hypothetical protein
VLVTEYIITRDRDIWTISHDGCVVGRLKGLKQALLTARLLAGWRGRVIIK